MRAISSLILLLLAGCSSVPSPAEVYLPPGNQKLLQQEQREALAAPAIAPAPAPPPQATPSVEPKDYLKRAHEAYIVCSLTAAKRLALQPEDPAHIAITATTLCGDQSRDLRIAATSVFGLLNAFNYMGTAESMMKEHVIAYVVTTRAKARQLLQEEQRAKNKALAKKGEEI